MFYPSSAIFGPSSYLLRYPGPVSLHGVHFCAFLSQNYVRSEASNFGKWDVKCGGLP